MTSHPYPTKHEIIFDWIILNAMRLQPELIRYLSDLNSRGKTFNFSLSVPKFEHVSSSISNALANYFGISYALLFGCSSRIPNCRIDSLLFITHLIYSDLRTSWFNFFSLVLMKSSWTWIFPIWDCYCIFFSIFWTRWIRASWKLSYNESFHRQFISVSSSK